MSCTSERCVRVRPGRIHLLWWCIVLLRSFIYCGWPLLNLLLVTEHDKRISSTPLHSSCIAQTTQIPHRPCRRETTKPAERITVLFSKSWGRIKHHMLVFFFFCSPQRIVQGSLLFKMLLQNSLRARKMVQCVSGTTKKNMLNNVHKFIHIWYFGIIRVSNQRVTFLLALSRRIGFY